jgi:hypothetical protein
MLEEWWKTFGEEEVHEKEYASRLQVPKYPFNGLPMCFKRTVHKLTYSVDSKA